MDRSVKNPFVLGLRQDNPTTKGRTQIPTDTWDVPFNPAKATFISDVEILNKLKLKKVGDLEKTCEHETEAFQCSCRRYVKGKKCQNCNAVFCDRDNCSALRSTQGKSEIITDLDEDTKRHLAAGDVFGENKAVKDKVKEVETGRSNMPRPGTNEDGVNKQENAKPRVNPFRISDALPASVSENKGIPTVGRGRGRGRGLSRFVLTEPEPGAKVSVLQKEKVDKQSNANPRPELPRTPPPPLVLDIRKLTLSEQGQDSWSAALGRFEKQPDLTSFASASNPKDRTLCITVFPSPFQVYVYPSVALKLAKDELLDEINDFCLDAPALSEEPECGACVCAPFDDGIMERAVVLKKSEHGYTVRFLDIGLERTVPLDKLKPFPDSLFKTPLMAYCVRLKDLPSTLPLLSLRKFRSTLEPDARRRKWEIEEAVKVEDGVWEGKLVSISNKVSLADSIVNLQTWEWELLFKSGYSTDVAIAEAGKMPWNNFDRFDEVEIPFGRPLKMQFSRNSNNAVLFKNIQLDLIKWEQRVFEEQLKRYVRMVPAAKHFPKIKEEFLFLPAVNIAPERNWRRAIRFDEDFVYCFDTDEFFPLRMNGDTRIMCPEFYKVPLFALLCTIPGEENEVERIIKGLQEDSWYDVIIQGQDPKTSDTYIVTIPMDLNSST